MGLGLVRPRRGVGGGLTSLRMKFSGRHRLDPEWSELLDQPEYLLRLLEERAKHTE